MKKQLSRVLIVAIFLALIASAFNINKTLSASYSFNFVGPTSANKGDTITLTITANGLTGKVKLSATNATVSDSQKWIEKNSVSITAKITGFPASITATPQELTDNDYNIVDIPSKTVTVNEIKKEESKPSNPTQQNQGQTNKVGTSQQNTNQGTQNQSQTTTPPPTTNYSNKSSNQSTSSSKPSKTTTSSTTGKQSASEQNKPKTEVIKNENATSSNNYLKSLNVNVGSITPNFDRENLEYIINDVNQDEIEVTAEVEDERATISGTGTIALIEGENIINVTVTAENLAVRNYKIIINKKQELTQSDLRLNTLEVKKINEKGEFYDLDIGFDKDKFDYSIEVEDDITDLDIIPTVEKEGIIIETKGNDNLIEGENNINITLTNQNDATQTTVYNLKIIKAEKPIVETYTSPRKRNNLMPVVIGVSLVIIATILYVKIKKENTNNKQ